MTETASKLKDPLASLPEEDRRELADFLLYSIDVPADEAAWDEELEKRWHEIENGTDPGTPADEVNQQLRAKYS